MRNVEDRAETWTRYPVVQGATVQRVTRVRDGAALLVLADVGHSKRTHVPNDGAPAEGARIRIRRWTGCGRWEVMGDG